MNNAVGASAAHLLDKLQTPSGRYAMLALDQRESLRGMFPALAGGGFVGDDALRAFKELGVRVLAPYASAVLLDRPYGLSGIRPPGLPNGCGLIVAVDVLHQEPGQEITRVTFDDLVTVDLLHAVGADAVKILVLWEPSSGKAERADLVECAIQLAAEAGVASLVEGIVRPDSGGTWASPAERHAAVLACAAELTAFDPDIYKAQVPGYVPGDLSQVAEQSSLMSEIVDGDWVVLSNGVGRDAFASAVEEARRGGASGFLAGRAIWADAVAEEDVTFALNERSIDRLKNLNDIVDREPA